MVSLLQQRPSSGVASFLGCVIFLLLLLQYICCSGSAAAAAAAAASVQLLQTPHAFSHNTTSPFSFEASSATNGDFICKLDDGVYSDCKDGEMTYFGLADGKHSFQVCSSEGSQGLGCASYNWTIDTVPPTAYITASTSFTNALNVSVDITFSESCSIGGGFGCSSSDACNLLVYGSGKVIPSSLRVVEPNLKYTLLVSIASTVQYGRLILVMDKDFCSDAAGNIFTRTTNSSFYVHFDRRDVFVNLRTHVPEKLLQLNNQVRTVQATNNYDNLKVYLYFSDPVLNTSTQILNSLDISQGVLLPIHGESLGDRRFGFMVANVSDMAIVTVSFEANSIISRHGTAVSPIAPDAFLYDTQRPAVRLSTTSTFRTRNHDIPFSVKFKKPVFGFNSSSVAISGGLLQSFREISRSIYALEIKADANIVSISIPENVTGDVAGNKNLPSNILQVRHYSVPVVSFVVSMFATTAFLVTCFAAGFFTISTATLQSISAFSRPSPVLTSEPSRNLFRIACYIQVFALSRWMAVTLPIDYYELARSLQWSIPYFSLPWEVGHIQPIMVGSTPSSSSSRIIKNMLPQVGLGANLDKAAASLYGLPLSSMEYQSFFEMENTKPEAEYILDQHISGWRDFSRNMFWLAVIGGSFVLLHGLLLLILKLKKNKEERSSSYGALTFPRFELFLLLVASPCVCQASAALLRGGTCSGFIVGIIMLSFVSFALLALLLFLSVGITFGKLLQYKEVHKEGQTFHWYQELIRVTLGPGKRGQWTWKMKSDSIYLTMLGPLFEDLRGPPKYMLTQISGGKHRQGGGDRIIASDDETEDAEAPFIQKLFGILRIYYTLLVSVKRVCLGTLAGAYLRNWSSRTPGIVMLCFTSFQLFFILLKKPFIKKKVQLVEIISLACEVGVFASCVVLQNKESLLLLSEEDETSIGIFMVVLFLVGFVAQLVNEWYALYTQSKRLDPNGKSFFTGLKVASYGILLLFIPHKMIEKKLNQVIRDAEVAQPPVSSSERNRSSGSGNSGSTDKPWLRQLRELAKASFSREGPTTTTTNTDPSSSRTNKWSGLGLWGGGGSGHKKSSRSSSCTSTNPSSEFKSRPRGLYKELEAIFASE